MHTNIATLLTVAESAALRETLARALADGGDVVPDLGGAETVHTAALQLLVAFRDRCATEGRGFRLEGVGHRLEELLRTAGLAPALADLSGTGSGDRPS